MESKPRKKKASPKTSKVGKGTQKRRMRKGTPPAKTRDFVTREECRDGGRKLVQYHNKSKGVLVNIFPATKEVEKYQLSLIAMLPLPLSETQKLQWLVKEGLEPKEKLVPFSEPTFDFH